jgi:hypothetical protein
MLDDYRNRVAERLSPVEGASPSRLEEVLGLPSFHLEVHLRVTDDRAADAVDWIARTGVWHGSGTE